MALLPDKDDLDELLIEEEIPELSLDISPKKRKKKEKDAQDYVDKIAMWNALKSYYDKCEDNPNCNIPNDLAIMVDEIITQMAHRPNFSGYVKQENWLDDMKGDARVKAFKSVSDKAFKLFTVAKIVDRVSSKEGEPDTIYFYSKKAKKSHIESSKTLIYENEKAWKLDFDSGLIRKSHIVLLKNTSFKGGYVVVERRILDLEDVIDEVDNIITFKANPFGFYSAIIWNCFINRIKKEKQAKTTQFEYQAHVYEAMYSEESWKNVRRQKVIYDDEEDSFVEEVKE